MKTHWKIATFALLSGLIIPKATLAATATTTFQVSATVLKACSVTANPLAFGSYDPTASTNLDATTTLSVLCTVGTSFQVGLNPGTATGATVTSRQMTNGANTLAYALYQDTARTTNWGNTPGTDTPAAITAPITATSLTVFGRVPSAQNVPAAGYSDTITVTVTY
ncbi:MAG: spore coat U domain-containing protein [Caulobacteraceae bacterium]